MFLPLKDPSLDHQQPLENAVSVQKSMVEGGQANFIGLENAMPALRAAAGRRSFTTAFFQQRFRRDSFNVWHADKYFGAACDTLEIFQGGLMWNNACIDGCHNLLLV